jgi:arylsulfatase A-like enzyme
MKTMTAILITTIFTFTAFAADRPNIFLAISDDQSWLHAGAMGDAVVKTPGFDRVAREGVLFTNAYCAAPTCGPSRSAIVTGQAIWRLEEAGNIHSSLPAKFETYTHMLIAAGYHVGYTSKGWSPGKMKEEPGKRTMNPAGVLYKDFATFLKSVPKGKPFCFWQGSRDPHRGYKLGSGAESGMDASKVHVPEHLPDNDLVRSDILDYYWEVQRFDGLVTSGMDMMNKAGVLDDTLIVVTSDHGMPFPRAKASLYDYGSRVPFAIRWPKRVKGGRTVTDFVGLADLAPTFVEAAGLKPPKEMTAKSLMGILESSKQGRVEKERTAAYIAMERHDGCRKGGKGYPCRAIRTDDYLYIYNFEATRWPSGSPDRTVCARDLPFGEIDSSPTKTFMMENEDVDGVAHLASLSFGMRPTEELYDVRNDPAQLVNLAGQIDFLKVQAQLRGQLMGHLRETRDPRVVGGDVLWDYYPYYGAMRNKDWAVDKQPDQ